MLYWKNIIPGPNIPEIVYAIIECPKGITNKYEVYKETNILNLDRTLHSSVVFPQDYGFIPGTYANDEDCLDILVLTSYPTDPKTLVECRPIGVLIMEDVHGVDEKILSVSIHDPHYNEFNDIVQLPKHYLAEIKEFFTTYKTLEETTYAEVRDWKGRDAAHEIIKDAIINFSLVFGEVATIDPKGN